MLRTLTCLFALLVVATAEEDRFAAILAAAAPEPSPRFHGPSEVGVRPGTPLVHRVATTGTAPITWSVDGLPPGLTLDPAKGILTGTLAVGTWPLTVTARNAAGSATKKFRVIAGDRLALTPPMGWNSYDAYGDGIDEAQFRANVAWFATNLAPLGYDTVVIDFRWYDALAKARTPVRQKAKERANVRDDQGRMIPAPNRFPSSSGGNGFKPLADEVHRQGLKFGIHIMRGMPRETAEAHLPIAGTDFTTNQAALPQRTCSWCDDMVGVDGTTEAGRAWYRSLAAQYAAWGVDFIKADDMANPYHADEIAALSSALAGSGRSIVLSLSPGETPLAQAAHVAANAHLWRLSGDFWDHGKDLFHGLELFTRWSATGVAGPGHWPDGDMLPVGHLSLGGSPVGKERDTHYSREEQLTLLSVWSLMPAPLMIGASLEFPDPWTTALLTNPEVLALQQDAPSTPARRVTDLPGGVQVWQRNLAGGATALALVNPTDQAVTVTPPAGTWCDLWQHRDLAPAPQTIPVHGTLLLRTR